MSAVWVLAGLALLAVGYALALRLRVARLRRRLRAYSHRRRAV